MIMVQVLSNCIFQYCDRNILLISIAPCKVIALYLVCFLFGIKSLHLLLISLSIAIALNSANRNSWKSYNYKGSFSENNPWTCFNIGKINNLLLHLKKCILGASIIFASILAQLVLGFFIRRDSNLSHFNLRIRVISI